MEKVNGKLKTVPVNGASQPAGVRAGQKPGPLTRSLSVAQLSSQDFQQ